jgi:hypothetical protein
MKKWLILTAILATFAGIGAGPADNSTPRPKQILINLSVFQGDPLGSKADGTLKCLAQPRLVTLEGREFQLQLGGEQAVELPSGVKFVAFGRRVRGTPARVKEGKVEIDLTLEEITPVSPSGERVQLRTEATRTIGTFKLGEVVKLKWGKTKEGDQVWAEVSVEELKQ